MFVKIFSEEAYGTHCLDLIRWKLLQISLPGYPYQGPKSSLGKLLSVGIACIGLPIFLLYICLMGRFLGRNLQTLYNKLVCCGRRNDRSLDPDSVKGREAVTRPMRVPGWVCLVIILLYLGLGTLTMAHMHGVSLVDGLVYTFSLLVTIGVTINSDADLASVLVTSLYILVGVAMMAMCAYCLSQVLAFSHNHQIVLSLLMRIMTDGDHLQDLSSFLHSVAASS